MKIRRNYKCLSRLDFLNLNVSYYDLDNIMSYLDLELNSVYSKPLTESGFMSRHLRLAAPQKLGSAESMIFLSMHKFSDRILSDTKLVKPISINYCCSVFSTYYILLVKICTNKALSLSLLCLRIRCNY